MDHLIALAVLPFQDEFTELGPGGFSLVMRYRSVRRPAARVATRLGGRGFIATVRYES